MAKRAILFFVSIHILFFILITNSTSKELQYCLSSDEYSQIITNPKKFQSRCAIIGDDTDMYSQIFKRIRSINGKRAISTKSLERLIIVFKPNSNVVIKNAWDDKISSQESWCKKKTKEQLLNDDYIKSQCDHFNLVNQASIKTKKTQDKKVELEESTVVSDLSEIIELFVSGEISQKEFEDRTLKVLMSN